ncbi:rhodanese-like domain-containing protein [Streptoalloteichus hindustanus]|uniref:Rhodanese-related sulfurtransferase n=1 Tax=Streptoalloteichus hindustanus TaxID=2017 RepID=A0A1M5MRW3_STRHI|nr:rhodanese-like domain-containing protein [Streptoalloteichus hindustanus]SHG79935.1 Rhodanese-related sulfurtransferase [Streptoalloteichus hindustanus]
MLPLITRAEIQAGIDAGNIVVVDTMPVSYYEREHLPTAVNIPGFPYEQAAAFTTELAPKVVPDKSATLVVYCANVACRNSELVGQRLLQMGYQSVYKYREGIEDWVSAGLPTVKAESAQ